MDREYCCLAERRLELATQDPSIQGYTAGVFWERNTLTDQVNEPAQKVDRPQQADLFTALHTLG